MKRLKIITLLVAVAYSIGIYAQQADNKAIKLSGELLSDQRILSKSPNHWAWNENRLNLQLDKKVTGNSKFHSEIWLRNIGLPQSKTANDLYNKGIADPYNLEIREAYVEIYGFLSEKLDLKIGRQRIAWGTADKMNPTDNLNPYDMEDLLDFGRHRGSDAINLNYYLSSDFSLQAVFIPVFQSANLPIGVFSNLLNPNISLPNGLVLKNISTDISHPEYNFKESSTFGFKFKGFALGCDFSLSYVQGQDGLPMPISNTIIPVDIMGGVNLHSKYAFAKNHIFGFDLATSVAGIGIWAEAAATLPDGKITTTNDFSALNPMAPPSALISDTTILKDELYMKYVVGADYHFANGMYLNVQYLHGFFTEKGTDALNDYFFLQIEKKFFDDKLKISPINGAFIISDWDDIGQNYNFILMPEISYMATDNAELSLMASIFDGKGQNAFSKLNDLDMIMLKLKYSF